MCVSLVCPPNGGLDPNAHAHSLSWLVFFLKPPSSLKSAGARCSNPFLFLLRHLLVCPRWCIASYCLSTRGGPKIRGERVFWTAIDPVHRNACRFALLASERGGGTRRKAFVGGWLRGFMNPSANRKDQWGGGSPLFDNVKRAFCA